MTLVLNIAAMLIAFVALIAMINGFLGWLGGLVGYPTFSLQTVFGWVLGLARVDARCAERGQASGGNLIANKTVINEFFAFSMFKDVVGTLSEKGKTTSRRSPSAALRTSRPSASRSAASAASRPRASPTSPGSAFGRFSPARLSAS